MPSSQETASGIASNPTNGVGTPCYVQVSGVGIGPVGIDLTNQDPNPRASVAVQSNAFGQVGQGHGATPGAAGSSHPIAQYGLTLSLSGATVNGVTYPTATEVIATVVDVLNDPITVSEYYVDNFVWQSLGCPRSDNSYYKRSNSFVSTTAAPASKSPAYPGAGSATPSVVVLGTAYGSYLADVVITAKCVGQAVVEVFFPTYDNSLGDNSGYNEPSQNPVMGIYAQVVVQVIP
jgi:hypothetical protein